MTTTKVIDENRVKETLSEHYSGILFHLDGYYTLNHQYDNGVDLSLKFTKEIKAGDKIFRNPSEEQIDIQLKSTTLRQIKSNSKHIVYDIKVKSYNKLIERSKTSRYIPYILILFVLPELNHKWVTVKKNSISLSNNAFWFIPSPEMELELIKQDSSTVSLCIPLSNKVNKDTFDNLFKLIPI